MCYDSRCGYHTECSLAKLFHYINKLPLSCDYGANCTLSHSSVCVLYCVIEKQSAMQKREGDSMV